MTSDSSCLHQVNNFEAYNDYNKNIWSLLKTKDFLIL